MSLNIIFGGTALFAVPSLKKLISSSHRVVAVYTQPDRRAGRGKKWVESPIKQYALKTGIPVEQPVTLNDKVTQSTLAHYKADIMLVVAYGLLLPAPVLTLFKKGCVNVHPSLLPHWRGPAPIQYAILSGEEKTGLSIMQMNQSLDAGDILFQQTVTISRQETAGQLHDRLAELGANLLLNVVNQMETGGISSVPQNHLEATYTKKIHKADAKLNWEASALSLSLKIRAFNPKPVAFTELNGKPLRIFEAEVLDNVSTEKTMVPGTLINVSQLGVDVATGDGILRLLTLQWPGGRVLLAKEFFNAYQSQFMLGITRFGNDLKE